MKDSSPAPKSSGPPETIIGRSLRKQPGWSGVVTIAGLFIAVLALIGLSGVAMGWLIVWYQSIQQ